jgi:DNA-binding CsgD family transcriptional regulator
VLQQSVTDQSKRDGEKGRRHSRVLAHRSGPASAALGTKLDLSAKVEQLIFGLSTRERAIVVLLLDSARPAQIARHLNISVHTVRQHLKHIFKKAKVHSQEELLELLRGG